MLQTWHVGEGWRGVSLHRAMACILHKSTLQQDVLRCHSCHAEADSHLQLWMTGVLMGLHEAMQPGATLHSNGGCGSDGPPPPPLSPHPYTHWCLGACIPQTASLLENVAALALRSRLLEARVVTASVSCDTWSLLAGRVNGARIYGEGWRSPLNLTARSLEVRTGSRRGGGARGLNR